MKDLEIYNKRLISSSPLFTIWCPECGCEITANFNVENVIKLWNRRGE